MIFDLYNFFWCVRMRVLPTFVPPCVSTLPLVVEKLEDKVSIHVVVWRVVQPLLTTKHHHLLKSRQRLVLLLPQSMRKASMNQYFSFSTEKESSRRSMAPVSQNVYKSGKNFLKKNHSLKKKLLPPPPCNGPALWKAPTRLKFLFSVLPVLEHF